MAPVRVALIGLSPDHGDQLSPGNWGALAHLKPLLASPHYSLVAVCNSSVASAQASIASHKLPSSVKAYGSPDDVANDADVDLVAVSVNVGKHLALTRPALLKKKDLLVEWPLGASLGEAQELTQLAKEQGVKAIVGLQFRGDPLLLKVKELVEGGSIGRVTSSVAWGCSSILPHDVWVSHATYYLAMESGGNDFYIFFGHFLDAFTTVLGDFKNTQSVLKTQHPTVSLVDVKTGQVVDPAYPRTAPDHILVQGELESGALASLDFRKAKKPVDGLGLRWLITGSEGEIEVTIPEDSLQMGHPDRAIRLRAGKEETTTIDWKVDEPKHVEDVPRVGINTARVYESLAQGSGHYATFESALKNHALLDKIARDAKYI